MTAPRPFTSALGPAVARYLALKEALGRRYTKERAVLTSLDSFLSATKADLDFESFTAWCRTFEHLSDGVRRSWMRIARNLCLYRSRTDPSCFVPDASQFPAEHQKIRPHIFTEAEIAKLLAASLRLRPGAGSPLRSENIHLALVLLYTTGLRRGELLRLTLSDYRESDQTLSVRESKFHKSRLLPLSSEGASEVSQLIATRRKRHLGPDPQAPLQWNGYGGGRPYTGTGFSTNIAHLFLACGIQTAAGARPRVHDFRHTFAVHALLRWYRAGADVDAKLPFLAAYMGHVSIASTQYYLRFLEPVTDLASERFEKRCGSLVRPGLAGEDEQ